MCLSYPMYINKESKPLEVQIQQTQTFVRKELAPL